MNGPSDFTGDVSENRLRKILPELAGLAALAAWYCFLSAHRPLLVGGVGNQAFSAQHDTFRMMLTSEQPDLVNPPLLKFALWLLFKAGIAVYPGIKIFFIVARTLTAWLLYRFARTTFGTREAFYALLFYLALPLFNSVLVGRETYALFLLFLTLLLNASFKTAAASDHAWQEAVWMGVWGGMAYLARFEGLVYFILFLGATAYWKWREKRPFLSKTAVTVAAFCAVACVYFIALWMETGHWTTGDVLAEAMCYSPIRFSFFQTELLPYEKIWGSNPHTFLGAFLHNPSFMAERIAVNFRNLLLMLGSLKGIPLYVWPFLGFGLLGTAGIWETEKKFKIHALLLLGCVPTLSYLAYHFEERYLSPLGTMLVLWVGVGIASVHKTVQARCPGKERAAGAAALIAAVLTAAVPWAVSMSNLSVPVPPSEPHAYHHRPDVRPLVLEAAAWLHDHTPSDTLLITEQILWSAHAGRPQVYLSPSTALREKGALETALANRGNTERRKIYLIVEEVVYGPVDDFPLRSQWFEMAHFGERGRGISILQRLPMLP